MSTHRKGSDGGRTPDDPWRVRISDGARRLAGAGILLDREHVLTCAHVVSDALALRTADGGQDPPVGDLAVDLMDYQGAPRHGAHVVAGCWFPPSEERGDIALLKLDAPAPFDPRTRLRRMSPPPDRRVRVFGFPSGHDSGSWAYVLVGRRCGPAGEWVQLDSESGHGVRVRRGFSGAAVVDQETGEVLGMIVGEYTDERISTMIPVETVIRYVPRVGAYALGAGPADPSFRTSGLTRRHTATQVATLQELAGWLAPGEAGDPGGALVLVGDGESEKSAVLAHLVAVTDREVRTEEIDAALAAVGLPMGAIDAAVDARGRTTAQVARRIVERLGILTRPGGDPVAALLDQPPPMSLVVDRADDAVVPRDLASGLLLPLARQARRRGIHLLIGCRGEVPAELRGLPVLDLGSPLFGGAVAGLADAAGPSGPGRRDDRQLAEAVESLSQAVALTVAAEERLREHHERIAPRVRSAPVPVFGAPLLRVCLGAIRTRHDRGELEGLGEVLDAVQRAALQALARAGAVESELLALLAHRDELRDRLGAYQAKAARHGLAEDPELRELHRTAREPLWRGSCDLVAAEHAVGHYVRAVHRRLGEGDRGGRR